MAERLNRALVVERTAELADRIGLAELTITRLGRELGIAPPGVYRHVAGLEELRRAIARRACRAAAAELATACAGLSGRDALAALARTLRDWAARHPAQYAALQIAPDPGDAEGTAAAEELLDTIVSALRAYRLRGAGLSDGVRLLRSTLHGFIVLELGDGFKQPRPVEDTFERIIDALDAVLREWSR